MQEKGNHEQNPGIDAERERQPVLLPGDTKLPPMSIADEDLSHITNWFECLRNRKQPNATVREGFNHSVPCIMAARSYEILEHPPA